MNIIEIGANNGGDTNRLSNGVNLWCFEPNPYYAELLNTIFKNGTNVIVIQKAVSNFDGTAYFNLARDGESSSLNDLTDFAINNTNIEYIDKVLVDVIRMDTFLTQININEIDYFHCDEQGEDLKILKSFGSKISFIKRGKIEVSLRDEIYANTSNNLNEVIQFLTTNGFEITNLKEIDIHKMNIYKHDCSIQFCKQNNKRLI